MSIIDLYYKLYHRRGTSNGSDIDLSEQGRVGGLSTGQPYKFTDNVNYDIKIVEDGTTTYIGFSKPGTAEATEEWKVMKLDTASGMKLTWARGAPDFLYAVTDMASLFA